MWGVLTLNTVGTTVGTSHTTVSTPGGTKVFPWYGTYTLVRMYVHNITLYAMYRMYKNISYNTHVYTQSTVDFSITIIPGLVFQRATGDFLSGHRPGSLSAAPIQCSKNTVLLE